jgi:hypothetical protein
MANTGLEVIDVPFTTMKNLTDYLGHPCCDRQINCSIERERGDFAIPRVPECGAPCLDGISPCHAMTVGDSKQAIGYNSMKTDHVDAYFKANGEIR